MGKIWIIVRVFPLFFFFGESISCEGKMFRRDCHAGKGKLWGGLTKSKEYTKIAVYHTGEHESSLDFRERAEERTEYGTNSFE